MGGGTTDGPTTLLETIGRINWTFAAMLHDLTPAKRRIRLEEVFRMACHRDEDDQAQHLLEWLILATKEDPLFHVAADTPDFEARAATSILMAHGPLFAGKDKVYVRTLEIIATGLFTADDSNRAKHHLALIAGSRHAQTAAIIRKAIDVGASQERISILLTVDNLTPEIRRVLAIALIRKSDDGNIALGIEIAALLERCTESALGLIKKEIRRIKELESALDAMRIDVACLGLQDIQVSYDWDTTVLQINGSSLTRISEGDAHIAQAKLLAILKNWSTVLVPGRKLQTSLSINVSSMGDEEWRISDTRVRCQRRFEK